MARDNAAWLSDLRDDGAEQQTALTELRVALLRGLRRGLAHRSAVDESFLEDAVQEALVRILEQLDQFEGRSRFLTWATSIAIHLSLSQLRRRRWRDVSLEDLTADGEIAPQTIADAGATPDVRWEYRSLLKTMHELIRSDLTERQRSALLAELKEMPLDEIARHLGSNRNAIYKLTHDARKRLRKGLELAGFTAEDLAAATAG